MKDSDIQSQCSPDGEVEGGARCFPVVSTDHGPLKINSIASRSQPAANAFATPQTLSITTAVFCPTPMHTVDRS